MMRKRPRLSYFILIIITMGLFLFGCQTDSTNFVESTDVKLIETVEDDNENTMVTTVTKLPSSTSLPSRITNTITTEESYTQATNELSETSTVTPDETMGATTLEPVVISTPLPTPTLTSEQKTLLLTELMASNSTCELPCWWGITPGEDTINVVPEIVLPTGLVVRDDGQRVLGGIQYSIDVRFNIHDKLINYIQVYALNQYGLPENDWTQYYLSSVLNHYGKPSRIQVFAPWRPDPGPLSYDLLLFYDDLGFVIEYIGLAEEIDIETGRACPHLTPSSINLVLYQPERFSPEEILKIAMPPQELQPIAPADVLYDWTSLETATELNVEEFYQEFKDVDDQECFDFVSYWRQ